MKRITTKHSSDELSQKVEKINIRIEAHIQNGYIKLKRVDTTSTAPGSWSER